MELEMGRTANCEAQKKDSEASTMIADEALNMTALLK